MGDKNQTPSSSSSSTALIVKDQEPQNPNPFLTLFSNFTKFFNFPLPKSPASTNPDAAVLPAGADNSKPKPKPPAVVTVPNRQTVAPLKLEAEDLEKDTNPVLLWQINSLKMKALVLLFLLVISTVEGANSIEFPDGLSPLPPRNAFIGVNRVNDSANQTFCIAKEGADSQKLEEELDWACISGKVDCRPLLQGQPCYEPDSVAAHASYAFDRYYHLKGKAPGSCDFNGVAVVTTTDPSHGSCLFNGTILLNSIPSKASSLPWRNAYGGTYFSAIIVIKVLAL